MLFEELPELPDIELFGTMTPIGADNVRKSLIALHVSFSKPPATAVAHL